MNSSKQDEREKKPSGAANPALRVQLTSSPVICDSDHKRNGLGTANSEMYKGAGCNHTGKGQVPSQIGCEKLLVFIGLT